MNTHVVSVLFGFYILDKKIKWNKNYLIFVALSNLKASQPLNKEILCTQNWFRCVYQLHMNDVHKWWTLPETNNNVKMNHNR